MKPPLIAHRTQQCRSSYHPLAVSTAYSRAAAQFHPAYTWAHTIDYQSDPPAGDIFDVDFTRKRPAAQRAAWPLSRVSSTGRPIGGNADFDQRHNLVFYSVVTLSDRSRWGRFSGGGLGNLGRNSLRAPGIFNVNVDISVSRTGGLLSGRMFSMY